MAAVSPNSDSNEMKAEMPEGTTTTTTTATTTTISTSDITTTATSDNATTDVADDASVTEKQKEDTGGNSDSLCPNVENLEKEQADSDSAVKSALPDIEKLTVAASDEEVAATMVRSTGDDTVSAVDNSITPEVTTAVPASEMIANEATASQDSTTSAGETEKLDISAAAEHNPKAATDSEGTVSNEAAASGDSVSPGMQPSAVVESSVIATTTTLPSAEENKENDTMTDEKTEGTGEKAVEKDLNGAAGKKESSVTMNDNKEVASSDDTDQFVDAKSSAAQESGVAEISGEKKEQSEVVQDEEGDEYDEEEQEAEPDDDEIEGNPAYIPKSGRYYMHDSRNTDEGRTPEPSSRSRADGKWKHDRFDERSQRPKTKRELLNRYGYDIRNEGNKTTGGNIDGSAPNSNTTSRTGGASRGASHIGNRGGAGRGRYSNRAPQQHQQQQQHQQNVRSNIRRPMQDGGAGRLGNRGGRRGEHHPVANHQRVQPGTRVFKNSPTNAQRGAISRTDNYRSYDRGGDNRRGGGENRRGGGSGAAGGGIPSIPGRGGSAVHTGGKRYSTQRLATSYAPDTQQPATQPPLPQPQPPPPPPQLQSTPTTGPIPIPPPDWRPPAFQGPIRTAAPPPQPPPPPPPPPIAVAAPVHNFRSSDIVYFDPQPQQLYRNPMPPRAKKRLEIVPPYQAKNSN